MARSAIRIGTQSAVRTPQATPGARESVMSPIARSTSLAILVAGEHLRGDAVDLAQEVEARGGDAEDARGALEVFADRRGIVAGAPRRS